MSPRAAGDRWASEREARRLALGAIFEADFGLRTPQRVLDRRLEEEGADPVASSHARALVDAVTLHRDAIDTRIEHLAPAYPVPQLARIDRALLRSAMGELLHCPATPTRVAIAEWVEMARTYSGEPTRRLMNGVLGQVANASTRKGPDRGGHAAGPELETTDVTNWPRGGSITVTASTYERLKKIVIEQLGVDEEEVKPESSFVDDLNADSLDLVELIMSLEEEFGTEISDEDAEKIRTVQDAVDYIDEHLNQ